MMHHRSHQGRFFWGFLLIIIGALFLLENMGRLDFSYVISTYWPVILIVIGLSILVGSNFRNVLPGLLFIIFGAFFLLAEMDLLEYSAWHYLWPVLIIIAGLWLLLRSGFSHRSLEKFPEIKEDDMNISTIFSGMKRRIESQQFRGGKASVIFGGIDIDFTRAGLHENKATIELTVLFGGIDIRIPRDWKVVLDATPILGAVEDKHRGVPDSEAKATLYIKGTAIFGGIEIKD